MSQDILPRSRSAPSSALRMGCGHVQVQSQQLTQSRRLPMGILSRPGPAAPPPLVERGLRLESRRSRRVLSDTLLLRDAHPAQSARSPSYSREDNNCSCEVTRRKLIIYTDRLKSLCSSDEVDRRAQIQVSGQMMEGTVGLSFELQALPRRA